jgi:hypothetical protein
MLNTSETTGSKTEVKKFITKIKAYQKNILLKNVELKTYTFIY